MKLVSSFVGVLKGLLELLAYLLSKRKATQINIMWIWTDPIKFQFGGKSVILLDTQKVAAAIQPVDAVGNPAAVENIVWSSSNPAVVSVTQSEDGLSAVVEAVGPLGVAQISVVGDALIGDGVEEIAAVADIEVKAGKAVGLAINFGIPEEKEAPPAP